ncbi:MAG: protein phosphatase CheZ [Georgfuchsia sp.]
MDQAASVSENVDTLEELFDNIATKCGTMDTHGVSQPLRVSDIARDGITGEAENVLVQVGHLTRQLHENLRALGYDKLIEKTAAEIPDASDRLSYVITMTEQAAERTLNATDVVKPIQDQLARGAEALSAQWNQLFAGGQGNAEFDELVAQTRSFLDVVPGQTAATNAQLMEIMMAQDFQDLTGQVIKKTTEIIQTVERQLLQLLLDNMPQEKRTEATNGLMNGPVVSAEGRSDVVTNQNQVDDLLESLGF